METDKTIDKYFYITGWVVIVLTAAAIVYFKIYGTHILTRFPKCTMYAVSGLYCPGCGGTRALFAFFRGQWLRAFVFHPIVPYAFILGGWFMLSQTIQRLSKDKFEIGLHFRPIYLWIALAIILVNWIVKVALILICGIHLLD